MLEKIPSSSCTISWPGTSGQKPAQSQYSSIFPGKPCEPNNRDRSVEFPSPCSYQVSRGISYEPCILCHTAVYPTHSSARSNNDDDRTNPSYISVKQQPLDSDANFLPFCARAIPSHNFVNQVPFASIVNICCDK